MTLTGWRARSWSCSIFWESKIWKKKILKHFQKRTNDPYFPRHLKTFKDLGRNNLLKIKVPYAQYWNIGPDEYRCAVALAWSLKKVFLFLNFLNFKIDFLANFNSENQTGTTVGKPRKFYTVVRGVDFLFFPAQILHDALMAIINYSLKPGRFGFRFALAGAKTA